MMDRLLYSVGKQNGCEGPNLEAGNNDKKSKWQNKNHNVVSILLGISPASEVYKLTFRNSVLVPSSWASRNNTGLWVGGKYTGTEIREP